MQVIVGSRYGMEWRAAYRLSICRTLVRGIMIDDCQDVVGMGMNTMSTMTADVLGDSEHENIGEGG